MTIDDASRATFTLDVDSHDVDVFVVYDANNDGTFASDEIVGSSTGPAGTDEDAALPEPVAGDVSGRRRRARSRPRGAARRRGSSSGRAGR